MEQPNPATPVAPTATPGSVPQVPPIAPAASPAPLQPGQETLPADGVVTIPLKEYRNLQRSDARVKSFDKRVQLGIPPRGTGTQPALTGDEDPALVERFNQSETLRADAEKRALQAEVRSKVRDIVEKPEYANIPKSTKDLILKNPAMLSQATSLDEALLDIEDFLGEQAALVAPAPGQPHGNAPAATLPQRETPPTVTHGNPAPADAAGLEDVSKLSGPLKTQAMIRNKVKEGRGVKPI